MAESRLQRCRDAYHASPLWRRWVIVKHRTRVTWGQWWADVCYLVRG